MSWFKRKDQKPSPPQEHYGIPTVKFDPSRVTDPVRAEVLNCVKQIEGLKPSDFEPVDAAALQCVSVGGDLHVLAVALLDASIEGMTKRKAGDIARHLDRRARTIMVFRLGRLAVSISMQGQGLGADLLFAAGERALLVAGEAGGVALAIDAKNKRAAKWYERFGAMPLLDDPLKLVLPLATIAAAIRIASKNP